MHIQENHFYQTRDGRRVGPATRNAHSTPDGWPWIIGGFHYTALGKTLHDTNSPLDIVAPPPGASSVQPVTVKQKARLIKIGVWLDFGILMASVTIDGDQYTIHTAWLEPAGAAVKIPLAPAALGSLAALRGNGWRSFEQLIYSRTQDELAA